MMFRELHKGHAVYYRRVGAKVHTSSNARTLAALYPRVKLDLDVLNRLQVLDFALPGATIFEGVHRLKPLTGLDSDRVKWEWPYPRWIRRRVLAKAVWRALCDSVRNEMRRAHKVAVLLSGGIDSSSVAAAAARVAQQEGMNAPLLLTMSVRGSSDETNHAKAVADHLHLPLIAVPVAGQRFEARIDQYLREVNAPVDLVEPAMRCLLSEAVRAGCEVVLTGSGADDLFIARGTELDLFRTGKFIDWWMYQRSIARTLNENPVSFAYRRTIRNLRRRPFDIPSAEARNRGGYGRAVLWRRYFDGSKSWADDSWATAAGALGTELVHPFQSPAFVDVVLAAPDHIRMKGTWAKGLLREALADHLPLRTLQRVIKANYYQYRVDVFRAEAESWRQRVRAMHDSALETRLNDALQGKLNVVLFILLLQCRVLQSQWEAEFRGSNDTELPEGPSSKAIFTAYS